MDKAIEAELIIFDWSGTISDDRIPVWYATNYVLKICNRAEIEFEDWLSNSFNSFKEFADANQLQISEAESKRLFVEGLKKAEENGYGAVLYEGIKRTLVDLKRSKLILAVMSTHPFEKLIDEAIAYGLFNLFSDISGGLEDKSAQIINLYEIYNIEPSDTVFVGDTIFDMRAAKKAGVKRIAVLEGYNTKEKLIAEKTDMIIEKRRELSRVIKLKKSTISIKSLVH